jgi:predicted anti-sigma-YlaC factor YlaD
MRTFRTRKSLVLFGVAILVFAAFVPALAAGLVSIILTPLWLVVPAVAIVVIRRAAVRCDDQPVALLSLTLFRAPPATLALA